MRIFIIGSLIDGVNRDEFLTFCSDFGKQLANKNVDLIVCSPYPGSADAMVISGIKKSKPKKISIELYHPNNPEIDSAWTKLLHGMGKTKIQKFKQEKADLKDNSALKYAWLFCQIQAINNSHFVIVIGGKLAGASNFLVRIADVQGKEIIPFPKFGGIASIYFQRKRYQLNDTWGENNTEEFNECENAKKIVDIIVEKKRDTKFKGLQGKKNENITFFISYARESPFDADFVEMILRRRNYSVFRDDNDMLPSEDVPNAIKENIIKSDVFIALWCREYACSPWCFDELSIALETHQNEGKSLWILRTDKTRMIPPKARNILWYDTETRKDIEGRLLSLLGSMKHI